MKYFEDQPEHGDPTEAWLKGVFGVQARPEGVESIAQGVIHVGS